MLPGLFPVEIKSPKERILFTGDILFDDQRTLDGVQPLLERVMNTLVTEAAKEHVREKFGKEKKI